jgi:hypothetical protein
MDIKTFAEQHKLRFKRMPRTLVYQPGPHPDGAHVPGRRGWIVEGLSAFKAFIQGPRIGTVLEQAKALRMELQGRGDEELMLWFDPNNPAQVDFALKSIRVYKRRSATPELLERLAVARGLRRMPVFA